MDLAEQSHTESRSGAERGGVTGLGRVQGSGGAAVRGHDLFLCSGCGVAMGRRFCAADSVRHWSMKQTDTNTNKQCVLCLRHLHCCVLQMFSRNTEECFRHINEKFMRDVQRNQMKLPK